MAHGPYTVGQGLFLDYIGRQIRRRRTAPPNMYIDIVQGNRCKFILAMHLFLCHTICDICTIAFRCGHGLTNTDHMD